MKSSITDTVIHHIAALLFIALTTLILRDAIDLLSIQIIVLIYLIPVMLVTALWGLTPGVLAGFAAFLAFNYYFIPPYFELTVHHTQDLITLIIFLVVSVVMSQIIGQAKEGTATARAREWEATRMYELISSLSGMHDYHSIAERLATHTLETFQALASEVRVDGKTPADAFTVRCPEDFSPAGRSTLRIPMLTVRGIEGEIRLWLDRPELTHSEIRLLETFANQGALSLERCRLSQAESRAQVLEESDRLKSSILNSVSHELRTPLASIKASVSSLRSGEVDWNSASRPELLEVIEEETDNLNQLVGNLLDMSRIEAGALNPVKKWNALDDLIRESIHKMRSSLTAHTITLNIPTDLPLIPADYIQMERVFINLFSNSVKYAPPHTEIKVSAALRPDQTVLVKVVNQGPSVPDEDLEKIFDKFYRITAADRVTGTGLGLSICKGIIQAHGGKIWAQNSKEGFTFYFTLPITLDGMLPKVPQESADD
jgi:two-component system, OmpR family, sensor histidine kinase KdpD